MEVVETIERIKNEFNENNNSHVFLFETDDVDQALNDTKDIIKDILKADNLTTKQIDDDNYIELINIKPDGKDIKKDRIIELQERIKTKPVLSNYIFYVISHAELLNDIASNKLLKTIEEPNDNVIGFLITNNTSIMLPTIKSRCQIETLYYKKEKSDEIDEKGIKIIKDIISIIEKKEIKDYIILENKEKEYIKDNGKNIANIIKDYYNTACKIEFNNELDKNLIEEIRSNNSEKRLIKKAQYINSTLNKLIINMNTNLMILKIVIELKEVI